MLFTGIDLVRIDRIERSIQNPRFYTRVFSASEREFFEQKKNPAPSCAANFAAKEAFSKALGTGVRGFSLHEVSVLRDELGAPFLRLEGKAYEIAAERNLDFSVSLTHTDEYAAAVVTAFAKEEDDHHVYSDSRRHALGRAEIRGTGHHLRGADGAGRTGCRRSHSGKDTETRKAGPDSLRKRKQRRRRPGHCPGTV